MLTRTAAVAALMLLGALGLAQEGEKKPDELKVSADESKLLAMVNESRQEKKLPPLKFNRQLLESARKHSANMAKQEKMDHVLDDRTPADRVKAEDYVYGKVGENIAAGTFPGLGTVHKMWMESEGHRANILDEDYTEIGVGVARAANGDLYFTQVFGKPLRSR